MRPPQGLDQINSEFPKNLVEALLIAIESANAASSMGLDLAKNEKVIEALLGAAIFAGLAVPCSNKFFVKNYVDASPKSGMLFIHKTEDQAFFIASSFINSLNFKEHAARTIGDRF
jgi:hypothetical protein